MRKRRGVKSEVAVEPMMVSFPMSSRLTWAVDCFSEVGHAEGWDVAASREGDWRPEAVVEAGLDGAREDTV